MKTKQNSKQTKNQHTLMQTTTLDWKIHISFDVTIF